MANSSRFECVSSALRLKHLLKRTERVSWVCLGVGAAMHVSLARISGIQAGREVVRPLTTQFVKRAPRLTKPLELKKRPQPKRRAVQREMVAVRARADREPSSARTVSAQMVSKLARPAVNVVRPPTSLVGKLDFQAVAAAVEGSKESANQVDMGLEMVDVEALDTGQYQAMIIQDPADKRSAKGFFHLARVYSVNTPPEEAGLPYPDPTALGNLVAAINRYTDIKADIVGTYTLDSQELLKTPFIFITCHVQFRLNESERVNLGRYLDEGGFLLSDDCSNHFGGVSDQALRTMIMDALGSKGFRKGFDWTWEVLAKDHPIYHCYFDLDGAPRTPWTHINDRAIPWGPEPEGITLHGRLVAMHSTWDIGCGWEGPDVYPECGDLQHHRLLQLGINMLIFAMTQEGSITHRILSGVNY